jgi:pimeloyl-ACP methyl ester carboxylesterase
MTSTFTTSSISIAGNPIAFDRVGAGSPVLLLHGAFQSRYLWREAAKTLAASHTVIAPDLRGIGNSGAADGKFDFKSVAAELAALMTALGSEKFAVVGHDLGGGVAYALAALAPERVTRFAFMDMLLPGFGFEDAWVPRPNGQFLWFAALNAVPDVIETLFTGRERDYLNTVLRGGFTANKAGITDADVATYAAAYARPGALAALGGYFRAMWTNAEHNKASAASRLAMPVAAFGGEFSVGAGSAQSMSAVADNVKTIIVPGSGHWLTEENPDYVVRELTKFLKH